MKYFVEICDEGYTSYDACDTLQDAKEYANRIGDHVFSAKVIEGRYIDEVVTDSNTASTATANALDSTIVAESGSKMTVRDSIDYIVSIILAGLNPANGVWYRNLDRIEWQLRDAIDDKELLESIMKQVHQHIVSQLEPID